jgi:hypothetical protein
VVGLFWNPPKTKEGITANILAGGCPASMKYKLSNPCTSFEFKVDSDAEILLGIKL